MSKQSSSSTLGHFKLGSPASKAVNSCLVLDGETVKLRLLAERYQTGNKVHLDWLRFTCNVRSAPMPPAAVLFPQKTTSIWEEKKNASLYKSFVELAESEFPISAQAHELASQVAEALGPDFAVDPEFRKGIDFYKWRWSILLNGIECGWVGFLSSSDSPRQKKQSMTIHCNIFGVACTFAAPGWNDRLAMIVDECEATITRVDLALDFFDGYVGGIEAVLQDYHDGLTNVGGRKLKFNQVGDWANGNNRSLYFGSREAGKITNIYEKGDQLFGEKTGSDWLRFELRYGNKHRVFNSDILRRPDDFFAGASDWHQSILSKADAISSPESVSCVPRLETMTVTAECTRNLRWLVTTAASSIAIAVECLDSETLWDLVGHAKLPSRLRKFSKSQVRNCFSDAVEKISSAGAMPVLCEAV